MSWHASQQQPLNFPQASRTHVQMCHLELFGCLQNDIPRVPHFDYTKCFYLIILKDFHV